MIQCYFDIINYIDDVIGICLPSITFKAFHNLQALVCHLGLDISIKKLASTDTFVNCLVIIIDNMGKSKTINLT